MKPITSLPVLAVVLATVIALPVTAVAGPREDQLAAYATAARATNAEGSPGGSSIVVA